MEEQPQPEPIANNIQPNQLANLPNKKTKEQHEKWPKIVGKYVSDFGHQLGEIRLFQDYELTPKDKDAIRKSMKQCQTRLGNLAEATTINQSGLNEGDADSQDLHSTHHFQGHRASSEFLGGTSPALPKAKLTFSLESKTNTEEQTHFSDSNLTTLNDLALKLGVIGSKISENNNALDKNQRERAELLKADRSLKELLKVHLKEQEQLFTSYQQLVWSKYNQLLVDVPRSPSELLTRTKEKLNEESKDEIMKEEQQPKVVPKIVQEEKEVDNGEMEADSDDGSAEDAPKQHRYSMAASHAIKKPKSNSNSKKGDKKDGKMIGILGEPKTEQPMRTRAKDLK